MSSDIRALWESAGGQLPDEWEIAPLESLLMDAKSIAVGVMYPGPDTPGGTPLIRVADIKSGAISSIPSYRISAETNYEYRRTQLVGDELLITLVGNPGECVVVKTWMAGWNPARAIAVVRLKDPRLRTYLKAVLESSAGRHLIDSVLNTTVQKTLNLKDIRKLPIPLPTRDAIDSISTFSEALTDRITLLRETNATLEATAQALFKSWFVDFDPVRAKMEGRAPEGMREATAALFPDVFEESEQGLIPRGWRVGILGDLVSLRNERTKPSAETALLPYVPIESISSKTPFLDGSKSGEAANSSLLLFKKGDILFGAMRPYFHKVCSAPFDGVTRTTVFSLKAKNSKATGYALFVVYQESTVSYATQHSEGSTIPYAKWQNSLENMPLVIPPEAVQEVFGAVIDGIVEKANFLIQRAQTFATLRDTLLPRLISGQLRLSEAGHALKGATP